MAIAKKKRKKKLKNSAPCLPPIRILCTRKYHELVTTPKFSSALPPNHTHTGLPKCTHVRSAGAAQAQQTQAALPALRHYWVGGSRTEDPAC